MYYFVFFPATMSGSLFLLLLLPQYAIVVCLVVLYDRSDSRLSEGDETSAFRCMLIAVKRIPTRSMLWFDADVSHMRDGRGRSMSKREQQPIDIATVHGFLINSIKPFSSRRRRDYEREIYDKTLSLIDFNRLLASYRRLFRFPLFLYAARNKP